MTDYDSDTEGDAATRAPWIRSSVCPEDEGSSVAGPHGKSMRIFAVVLILHFVAVGGILAYKMIERATTDAKTASGTTGTRSHPASPGRSSRKAKVPDRNIVVDDPSRLGMKHYRVRSGDNLLAVAHRMGVSVSELEKLNALDRGRSLYPGMILLLPEKKISSVAPEEIERLLKPPPPADHPSTPKEPPPGMGEVRRATPVAATSAPADSAAPPALKPAPLPSTMKPQIIARAPAPAVAAQPRPVAPTPEPALPPVESRSYQVVSGDTFYAIARKFGIDYRELMAANRIDDPRLLQAGQEIVIPGR